MNIDYVYKVYSTFHADDESLVFDYGIFSTYEKAKARLEAVIAKKEGEWEWSETGHSVRHPGGWPGEEDTHYIDKIGLDCDIEETITVWT